MRRLAFLIAAAGVVVALRRWRSHPDEADVWHEVTTRQGGS